MWTRKIGPYTVARIVVIAVVLTGLVLGLLGMQRLIGYTLYGDQREAVGAAADQVHSEFGRARVDFDAAYASGDPEAIEQVLSTLTSRPNGPEAYQSQSGPGQLYALIVFQATANYTVLGGGRASSTVRGCAWLQIRLNLGAGGEPTWENGDCPPRGTGPTVQLLTD